MPTCLPPLAPRRGGLVIPRLGDSVPHKMVLSEATHRSGATVHITEALLMAGALKETDWCGGFLKTMQNGLSRYVDHEIGCSRLSVFHALQLEIYDCLEEAFDDEYREAISYESWHRTMAGDPSKPIGAFALYWGQHPAECVLVATKTRRLEQVSPGLGFGLLALIERAFGLIGFGHGFKWGLNIVEEAWDEWEGYEDDHPDTTLLTPKLFFEIIPKECTTGHWDAALVERVLNEPGSGRGPRGWISKALLPALELYSLVRDLEERYSFVNHVWLAENVEGMLCEHPVVYLSWDPQDAMHRIVDDTFVPYIEMGTMTSFACLQGFQIGHPGVNTTRTDYSTRTTKPLCNMQGRAVDAAGCMMMVLKIVKLLDGILSWMEGDRENEQPVAQIATRQETLAEQVRMLQY